jgi:hypothetical protein
VCFFTPAAPPPLLPSPQALFKAPFLERAQHLITTHLARVGTQVEGPLAATLAEAAAAPPQAPGRLAARPWPAGLPPGLAAALAGGAAAGGRLPRSFSLGVAEATSECRGCRGVGGRFMLLCCGVVWWCCCWQPTHGVAGGDKVDWRCGLGIHSIHARVDAAEEAPSDPSPDCLHYMAPAAPQVTATPRPRYANCLTRAYEGHSKRRCAS